MTQQQPPREKRHVPVILREAETKDIPQIFQMAHKFAQPDPETGDRKICCVPTTELLQKIVAVKECVVAVEKLKKKSSAAVDNDENDENDCFIEGKVVGYNLRRSQTPDDGIGSMVQLAKTLKEDSELDGKMFAPMIALVKSEDVNSETGKIKNPFFGLNISIANQTVVDTEYQGTNVIDELNLAQARNCVERFGQVYLLASVVSSNIRSLRMTDKVGGKLISISDDGTMKTFISPNLVDLVKHCRQVEE